MLALRARIQTGCSLRRHRFFGIFIFPMRILAFRAKAVGFSVRIGFRLLFSDANKPRLHVIITD